MTFRRYGRTPIINGGKSYGTSYLIPVIRSGIANGSILYTEIVLAGSERLDTLAGKYLGDSSLWWILAACSGIGYGLQVPTGTLIKVPRMSDLSKFI